MKKIVSRGILPLILTLAALSGGLRGEAASVPEPWPTHAPDATPYVRVYDPAAEPTGETEPEQVGSVEEMLASLYEPFGHFYARGEELEMFRALPQDEPFSFVPHSVDFSLEESGAMRLARLFSGKEGCAVVVRAMHQLIQGEDDWAYLPVVTMTPARLFELSEEIGEPLMIEQFYDTVEQRFDQIYWEDTSHAAEGEVPEA